MNDPAAPLPGWLRWLKRLLSIRASILLAYFIVVGGGVYLLMDFVRGQIQPRYLESMEESLVDTANILASMVEVEMAEGKQGSEAISRILDGAYSRRLNAKIYSLEKEHVDLRVYLTDAKGRAVYNSTDVSLAGADYSRWRDVALTLQGQYGARATWETSLGEPVLVLYVSAPVRQATGIVGALTVGKPTTYVNELVERAEERFRIYILAASLVVLVLGALLSLWLTQPIQKLIRYAEAVRDGKAVERPSLVGMEANALGNAFEEMRLALEGKQYVEQYTQSLTHQLKSPLSAIIGAAELLDGEMTGAERSRFVGNVQRESARMRRIVDRMLDLASLESRRRIRDVETFDFATLVAEAIRSAEALPEAARLRIRQEGPEALAIAGERFLVRQAIANGLENAIAFSPEGGTITVSLRTSRKTIDVAIEDEGDGIPSYAIEKVYDRFYSLPSPRTGTKSSGIGLSFVKEIMSLHRGEARLENREIKGARLILRFPRPSAD